MLVREVQLSLSVGTIALLHNSETTLDEYLTRADKPMYHMKRLKKEIMTAPLPADDLNQSSMGQTAETRLG
jgi:hypothetical protein